ncbi:FG-GAP-like repeat-containing protein [Aliifodinibius sp. S!AR15-10]|uniref:FG-GAP-like repeat-containing protein n=1 Tax=Aliifodinibius sp. S!AR15-10 TaxID=2950437 RepID=UPI002870450F|nr:FG-GAP-like repeat-containing protein [Aliifodinibius sp. S!AR15-10]
MKNSASTNIEFRNQVSQKELEENRVYLNGSGVAVGDVDADGLVDIYFAGLRGSNKLYKNLGNYKFRDITEEAGIAHEGYNSTGVVFADVDGDSDLDLLVASVHKGVTLYINNGKGYFMPAPENQFKSTIGKGNTTFALADIDNDRDLDLYITNYSQKTARDIFSLEELTFKNTGEIVDGEYQLRPPFDKYFVLFETEDREYRGEYGTADELYINLGNGKFKRANDQDHFLNLDGEPINLQKDWGLTATFRDVNGDMLPDLYVANDFWTPDRFWINQGNGMFKPIQNKAITNMSFASMGVDFSDINRDGALDFVVTEMLSSKHGRRMRQLSQHIAEEYQGRTHHNRNSLYLNRGDNTFAQISNYSNLEASEWSWATSFMDINLDGYEDLIVNTGFLQDPQDLDTQMSIMRKRDDSQINYPILKLSNKIFRNNGDLTFTGKSGEWGFEVEDISMGMALGDLNNDGDLDLVSNRFNEEAVIYENTNNTARIAVRLKGENSNTQGVGAKIELKGGPTMQQKEVYLGGNYLSGSQPQAVFAANPDNLNHELIIRWPSGKVNYIKNLEPNRIYEVYESSATETIDEGQKNNNIDPLFEDISGQIEHEHNESSFDDYKTQALLPKRLSEEGPGIAWIDYNDNGREDLFIASGKDGKIGIYENSEDGQFNKIEIDQLSEGATGDQTSVIGWKESDQTKVVIGSANFEKNNLNSPSAYIYTISQDGEVKEEYIPGIRSTTGPIAAADYSGDGYVDLFIGGRFIPGQYPTNATSRMLTNENGDFQIDTQNQKQFKNIGLVTGAVFTDYNQDGDQDLLLSTEWGTLRLFQNKSGIFYDVTTDVGLDQYKGWWHSVATGDFTNDGLPDFVATNIGTNSPYQIGNNHPLKLYYDDFNGDRQLDIIDAYYDEQMGSYVPRRKLYDFDSISTILRNVDTHDKFSRSSLKKIFNKDFSDVPFKEINTLEHMVFINTGNGFKAHPLPAESQFSISFNAGVADFDNDGNEDLLLSQNFFSFPSFVPRMDAGRGMILNGDGEGHFSVLDGTQSGVKIYGEQRGAAMADFNKDGKTDLAVTQNDSKTKLFKNRSKKAGIRVTLIGSESNRDAIGSSLRVIYADNSKGPRREIQAGSGHWSQNSTTQVMGFDSKATAIQVEWFDGSTQIVDLQKGKMEYQIKY